jgi:hypothetical protein
LAHLCNAVLCCNWHNLLASYWFSLYHSIPLSCYTNLLQSPFHTKLKLLTLNKSILSIKRITLKPHTIWPNYNSYIHFPQEVTYILVL